MTNNVSDPASPQHGHPISVVAARTGLSRDVLRVWERRYGAVEPIRTPGGQRRYSDEHVERFRLLAAAIRHGRAIGSVVNLGAEELSRLVAEDEAQRSVQRPDGHSAVAGVIDAALAAIQALDAPTLDALLRRAIAHGGMPHFVDVLAPMLMREVGDQWVAGRLSIAHEHLVSAVLVEIVMETVRSVPPRPGAPRAVVATPSGDHHSLGAALAAAAASLHGWSVVYLGADVPHADIAAAVSTAGAHAVALSIVYVEDRAQVLAEVRALRRSIDPAVPLLIGGAGTGAIAAALADLAITRCESLAQLRNELANAESLR